jgi:hypothetical protein
MARSRIIKPEFFQNEELVALPPIARLLFIGLWQLADRDGRQEDRPGKIKLAILPADDCDVDDLLRQLAEKELIVRYEVAGTRYLAIPKFLAHQCPHISEKSKGIPPPNPPSAVQAPDKHSASTILAPDKHRTSLAHSDSDCGSGSECDSESGSDPDSLLSPVGESEKGLPTDSSKDDSEKLDSKSTSPKFSDEDLTLARVMYDGIKAIQPNARQPNLDRWANDMRLLRADGKDRTAENIRATLAWVRLDDFWKGNVMCPAKLREKWDQLQIKKQEPNHVQGKQRASTSGFYQAPAESGRRAF